MTRRGAELVRVLTGGVVATGTMTGLTLVSKTLGLFRLDFGRLLGTLLAPDSGRTRAVGWGLHAANGTLFALGYQLLFRKLGMWPGAQGGALLGLAHAGAALGVLAALPSLHPRPRQAGLQEPGSFSYGPLTIPGMLLGHVLYGAIAGWAMGRESGQKNVVSPAFLRWLQQQEESERAIWEERLDTAPTRLRPRRVEHAPEIDDADDAMRADEASAVARLRGGAPIAA